jgi:hypothetical protein
MQINNKILISYYSRLLNENIQKLLFYNIEILKFLLNIKKLIKLINC